jgi:membrane-bound serine protease (ClpP class)
LLALGVLGIIFEIKTGAFGIGALLGLLSFALFFGASYLSGLAGWHEVLLLGLGAIALAVEAFILPGFGAAGILGFTAVATAVVLAMVSGSPTLADVGRAVAVLGASLLITILVIYAWFRHLPNRGRFAGLFLQTRTPQAQGYISAPPRGDLIGSAGVALTDLRPAGTAEFGGERLDVVTEGEYLPQGTPVQVVRSEGYRHVVRAVREEIPSLKGTVRG